MPPARFAKGKPVSAETPTTTAADAATADASTSATASANVPSRLADEIAAAKVRGEEAAAAAAAKPEPAPKPEPTPKRHIPTPAEIEADIAAARERLTETLVQLEDAVTPASVVRRAKTAVKNVYVDSEGGIKMKNVAITAGVAIGSIIVIKIIK